MSVLRGDVRKATPGDAGKLAWTLAEAFRTDPIFGWMIPDEARRRATTERAFDLYLRRIWLDHGETYLAGDCAGACVWVPPRAWELGVGEQLRMVLPMARIYRGLLPRVMRVIASVERNHPREDHYYLAFIGVEPQSQGRGLGSLLMHPVLSRCDEEGVGAYLEASSPGNRALYERHGFAVTEEIRVGRGSPPMWRMWREPR